MDPGEGIYEQILCSIAMSEVKALCYLKIVLKGTELGIAFFSKSLG
jgi:hypothetical protein